MGLGRQGDQQGRMYLAWDEVPRSRGHAFYDRLQKILRKSGFDAFAEKLCQPFYSEKGRPSIPPGRYFRMHLVGYFEGIDSERGIEWRCADSLTPTPPRPDDPADLVADKGYFSRDVLKDLDDRRAQAQGLAQLAG